MRYPREHKQAMRKRIIREAARRFRQHGADGFSIADLMHDLQLTHGGFYRHFKDKDQLFAESLVQSMQDAKHKLIGHDEHARSEPSLRTIIERYLSPWHCANPAEGCPVAALASQIPRQPRKVRDSFDQAVYDYIEGMEKVIPGKTQEERQQNFLVLISGMAGTLNLARAVSDDKTREKLLRAAKDFYIHAFAKD
ncbi:MAG: transcriptional regulator, TetR family [Nitrospira sp.]|jgi:TetR/AcrR family transcriptional repressor of nem operon|nr:transcriptional regulator, TetR family [Nitrospira sp.]